jgi:hypothetical protein
MTEKKPRGRQKGFKVIPLSIDEEEFDVPMPIRLGHAPEGHRIDPAAILALCDQFALTNPKRSVPRKVAEHLRETEPKEHEFRTLDSHIRYIRELLKEREQAKAL